MKKRKTYTANFKLKVVTDRNKGLSLQQVADKHLINKSQVAKWTKNYNEFGEIAFEDKRGKHK